jgi:flagellar FliL protein
MPPAAKSEPKDAKETPPPAEAPKGEAASGIKALLPLIAAVVLAPALTFVVAEFVLVPRLRAKLSAPVEAVAEKKPEASRAPNSHGGKGEPQDSATYDFKDVVVNLAGTMGTRYLKTSFVVTGKGVRGMFEGDKARLADVTLNVLSAVSLADLEQAGAKNLLRGKLVNAYNQALGKHVVDQVYFSDFVIQ